REALVDLLAVIEIIDKHEGLGCIAAKIEANRWPGPVNLALAFDLVEKRARAIAQTGTNGAGRLAPGDIGTGFTLIAQDILDDAGKALGTLAEDTLGSADEIIHLICDGRWTRHASRSG